MCDCYEQPCHICGTEIPLHLSDYDTARSEILVYCKKCSVSTIFNLQGINNNRCLVWKAKGYGKILIAYLTDNAWKNRMGNCPNTGDAVLDSMKDLFMERARQAEKEAKRIGRMMKSFKKRGRDGQR
jgi:hypothetical protein